MQHQRMQEKHIAHLPRDLYKRLVRHPPRYVAVETQVLAFRREGRVLRSGRHPAGDAFGVGVEMLRDVRDARGADDGAAARGDDVGPEGDDEEGLLRGVEVVDEEVAVDVPV